MSNFSCTKCGSHKEKTGQLSGYANIHKGFKSSKLIATFCGDCGHVDAFKVHRPNRF